MEFQVSDKLMSITEYNWFIETLVAFHCDNFNCLLHSSCLFTVGSNCSLPLNLGLFIMLLIIDQCKC